MLISVILPAHNARQTAAEAIGSILAQEGVSLELIAVDDASDDGTLDLMRSLEEKEPRLHVLALAANGGAGAARNAGLGKAKGDYIYFADADDLLPPGALAALAADPADITVGGYLHERCAKNGDVLQSAAVLPRETGRFDTPAAVRRQLCRLDEDRCFAYLWNKLYRRGVIEGLRFGTTRISEDLAFNCAAFAAAAAVRVIDTPVYRYRNQNDASLTRRWAPDGMALVEFRFEQIAAALERTGPLTPAEQHYLANTHIRHALYELARCRKAGNGFAAVRAAAKESLASPAGVFSQKNKRASGAAAALCNAVFATRSPAMLACFAAALAKLRP